MTQFQVGKMRWVVGFFLLLCSCSPNSSQEFHREGKARCRMLVLDLRKIENREQLLRSEAQLKKHFESLITLMIEAREFQQKHLDEVGGEGAFESDSAGVALEEELRRIYLIEGGREIIEKAQHEALIRLDAYERALVKRREQPIP
jgi:hypothetical protein